MELLAIIALVLQFKCMWCRMFGSLVPSCAGCSTLPVPDPLTESVVAVAFAQEIFEGRCKYIMELD